MSWEDEEDTFVPTVPAVQPNVTNDSWEDEDETVPITPVTPPTPPSAIQLAAAKKAREEEILLANKLKFAQLENETPEQRKLRERKQVEDADAMLASELFGGQTKASATEEGTTGIGGIPIKTKQDHSNFGILCASKMESSTAICLGAFMKEITTRTKDNLTLESLEELVQMLSLVRDRKKAEKPVNKGPAKKSKKEIVQARKVHSDIYGGDDDDDMDRYQKYSGMEDDFM